MSPLQGFYTTGVLPMDDTCEPFALASGLTRMSLNLATPDASAITLKSVPKSMLAFLCGCCSAGQNDTDPTTANAEKG